ncbi:MAG: hypothetical protein L6428_04565 [Candidatus Aminicenantes bacterium]|nr:hypothetical protein [Candidatus Aminicenantes bacterium]
MIKIKAIILRNELVDDHAPWIKACDEFKESIEYSVVDLTADRWLEEIQQQEFDILLAKPGGLTAPFKQLYDERIYILGKVMGYSIFPSLDEIFIYENKRFLSFWLQANRIPHPQTHVFYDQQEAIRHVENTAFPIVAKTNIGASGSGVRILPSKKQAIAYLDRAFSGRGAAKRTGPNLVKGGWLKRGFHYILHPGDIKKKLNVYKASKSDLQIGFVILQEFIPHEFEWRVVRIGDSFFAHKKLKLNDKASGSLLKRYENPPLALLDFVKAITDRHSFYSQAVDIFESSKGYLVNEMQCIFGQSDPYQMQVDGQPGRYLWKENGWNSEPGAFNSNESYDLRVEYIIDLLNEKKS